MIIFGVGLPWGVWFVFGQKGVVYDLEIIIGVCRERRTRRLMPLSVLILWCRSGGGLGVLVWSVSFHGCWFLFCGWGYLVFFGFGVLGLGLFLLLVVKQFIVFGGCSGCFVLLLVVWVVWGVVMGD